MRRFWFGTTRFFDILFGTQGGEWRKLGCFHQFAYLQIAKKSENMRFFRRFGLCTLGYRGFSLRCISSGWWR